MAIVRNKRSYTGRERAKTDKLGDTYFESTDFTIAPDGKVSLSDTGAVQSFTSDSGDAAPVGGEIDIAGGEGIDTSATGNTVTIAMEAATTENVGGGEIATDSEADGASVSTNKFLVPSNLAALTATNLSALTASDSDTLTGTSTAVYTTPASINSLKDATDITFTQSPVLQSNANTGAAPSGSTGDVNLMMTQEGEVLEQFIMGAGQTIIAPRMAAEGLLVSLDLTDNEGAEYNWGTRANSKHAYTIGTAAPFFVEWRFRIADVTGADPVGIGFRKQEANNGTLASYTDFAFIGVSETDNTALISLKTRLNSGGVTTTDTTDGWTDGQTHTLKILVDASGNVTYEIDGSAPTATAAFQFDNADVVMPFFHGLHGTTSPGAWNWVHVKAGLQ